MKVFTADIGGTNARIAIVQDLDIETVKVYPTRKFSGPLQIFNAFLREYKNSLPKHAAIAAAGVVEAGRIKGTNIQWNLDVKELKDRFKFDTCIFLNDFEAAAWGLFAVQSDSLIQIGGKEPDPVGPKALLGAGTGLGEAILIKCMEKWHVIRTEGGHSSFSPRTQEEIDLLIYLRKRFDHVSFERILSGSGIVEIYRFLLEQNKINMENDDEIKVQNPADITELAVKGYELALKTMDIFCRVYGEEASNLALKCLSIGGVYISGGIVLHMLPIFLKSHFRTAFEDKGRMSSILKNIPVFIVNEPYLGLLGGAYRLKDLMGI